MRKVNAADVGGLVVNNLTRRSGMKEVTDEIALQAFRIYSDNLNANGYHVGAMRAALEAVFASVESHIADVSKMALTRATDPSNGSHKSHPMQPIMEEEQTLNDYVHDAFNGTEPLLYDLVSVISDYLEKQGKQ